MISSYSGNILASNKKKFPDGLNSTVCTYMDLLPPQLQSFNFQEVSEPSEEVAN